MEQKIENTEIKDLFKKPLVNKREFSIFKKLATMFSKEKPSMVMSEEVIIKEEKQEDPRDKKIYQLIESDLLSVVYEMELNGYALSLEQKKLIENKLFENMNRGHEHELKNLLQKGYQLSHEFIIDYLHEGRNGPALMKLMNINLTYGKKII